MSIIANMTLPKVDTDEWLFILFVVIRLMQALAVLIGNSLVMCAFLSFYNVRNANATGWMIFALATADIMATFLPPLYLLLEIHDDSSYWTYICHMKLLLTILYVLANIFFSVSIALERFITLSYPLNYQVILTPKRTAMLVTVVWSYLLTYIGLLPLFYHDHMSTIKPKICLLTHCLPRKVQYTIMLQAYSGICVTFILYVLIARIAWTYRPRQNVLDTWKIPPKQWKITKMMASITLIYGVLYIPSFLIDLAIELYPYNKLYLQIGVAVHAFYITNSWVNPLMYMTKNPEIRAGVRRLLPQWLAIRFITAIEPEVITPYPGSTTS